MMIDSLIKIIRLQPFDTASEQGRSMERHRRIALTALVSAAAKAITIATTLIIVPLTLNYLGSERYGLWMTISSVIAMMVFADFGIGNGLMNAISESYGKNEIEAMKRHISNAMAILGTIAILILIIFFAIYPFVHWAAFFNVASPLAIQESGPAFAIFMIFFALSVPAGIVQRVQMGLQQGFTSSMWQAGGSVLGLLLTLVVIHYERGLSWLVLAFAGAPFLVLMINGLFFFLKQRRDLLPDKLYISRTGIKTILYGGMLFFVLQIAVALAYSSDNIIIAQLLGAEAVAQYAVVSRIFEGVLMVIGLAFAPLWPAYGEAKARGDKQWVKKTLARSMLMTLILVCGSACLLVTFYEPLFALWVGPRHIFPFSLIAAYGIWMILKGLGFTYSMFLNGLHVLKSQLIAATAFMIVSIIAKIWFVSSFGLIGILFALILSYSLITIIPYSIMTKKILVNSL